MTYQHNININININILNIQLIQLSIKKKNKQPTWTSLMVKWLKNPPAGAEDSGLIPSLGRVHVPQGNLTHASQPLKSVCPRDCALQHGKPPQPEAHTPSGEQPPPNTTRGSS